MRHCVKLGIVSLWLLNILSAAPSITAGGIVNANGYQPLLSPGVVFVIFGSGLGPGTLAGASAPNYPESLAETRVTFARAGSAAVGARVVYTVATQVAGLLPSSVTPGEYSVTVTYNGETSAPQTVTVVARSFGIATANSAGSGAAQATIGDVNGGISLVRLSQGSLSFGGFNWTLTPARAGQTVVLWGTGGGADIANDTGGSSGDQTSAGNFRVLIGGREVTPTYAGTSPGLPGLWQVNFVVPSELQPDCFVPVQVTAGGEAGNAVTIAIAPPGQATCSSAGGLLTAEGLAKLDAGGTLTGGGFTFVRVTATNSFVLDNGTRTPTTTATVEAVQGGISRYSAAAVAELNSGTRIQECVVHQKSGLQSRIGVGIPDSGMDAGARLPVMGPRVATGAAMDRLSGNYYSLTLPVPTLAAGTYSVSGSGGADIAAFSGSLEIPGDFAPTNFDGITSLNRAQPPTLTWTGGAPGHVQINGTFWRTVSGSSSNPPVWRIQMMTFTCTVPASRGTYTVPAAVFALLPPSHRDLTTGNYSYLSINAVPDPQRPQFRYPLTRGGQTDWGTLHYSIGATKNIPLLP